MKDKPKITKRANAWFIDVPSYGFGTHARVCRTPSAEVEIQARRKVSGDPMTPCVVCGKDRDEKRDDPATLVHFKCSNRILRHLRELEEYLPTLSLERSPSAGAEPVTGPGFGSRSPANDAVIVHLDPRSDASNREGEMTGELGALGVVSSWARVVAEERCMKPAKSAFLDIGFLRRHHDWITKQPWCDEYAAELRQVHGAVRALAHDPVPRSVGKCINIVNGGRDCGGAVYEQLGKDAVQCADCNRLYDGTDLIRLRMSWEAS